MVGSRYFPVFSHPDKAPTLELNKKEQDKMTSLNLGLSALAQRKLELIRSAARRQGITADKLEDLKSESGRSFVEEKTKRSFFGKDFRMAVVRKETTLGSFILEAAYLCHGFYSVEDPDSCGWVRGNPNSKNYDNIGFLSGSAGVRHYCKICGKLIGEDRHTVS